VGDEHGRLDLADVLDMVAVVPERVDVAGLVAVLGVEVLARRGAERPPVGFVIRSERPVG
jgi:hypothetical protein